MNAGRWVLLVLVFGCRSARAVEPPPPPAPPGTLHFSQMCDASGAFALSGHRFAVVDDEDNILRVYDATGGDAPVGKFDLSTAVPLSADRQHKKKKHPPKKSREMDLEGATRLGPDAFWLTSHGLKKSGKLDTARFFLFATTVPEEGRALEPIGTAYSRLIEDLLAAEALKAFHLEAASERLPKEKGGLNIEGLSASLDGKQLLLGFRNPIPDGKALVVAIQNPRGLMNGEPLQLGAVSQLDLGGLGVRAMTTWRGRYLIAAGAFDSKPGARLFWWDGKGKPVPDATKLGDLNVEGFVATDASDQLLLLSDDGGRELHGEVCKDLKDAADKRFRGLWFKPATPAIKM